MIIMKLVQMEFKKGLPGLATVSVPRNCMLAMGKYPWVGAEKGFPPV